MKMFNKMVKMWAIGFGENCTGNKDWGISGLETRLNLWERDFLTHKQNEGSLRMRSLETPILREMEKRKTIS